MNLIFSAFFTFIQLIGRILFDYWGWVPILGYLSYLVYQNSRKQRFVSETEYVLLVIEVPKDNEKQELSAEQMFASLHGILRPKQEIRKQGAIQEHISFEIVSADNQIHFYIWTPKHLQQFVESQVYAQYPSVHINVAHKDYAKLKPRDDLFVTGTELKLTNRDILPIRTFKSFEVDPLAGITSVLAQLSESKEQIWIQILARPVDDTWHNRGERFITRTRSGRQNYTKGEGALALPFYLLRNFFVALWQPPQDTAGASNASSLNDTQQAQIQAVNDKIAKLGYQVKIRFLHIGDEPRLGRLRTQALVGAFKQFNDTHNGFTIATNLDNEEAITRYKARLFKNGGEILNIEELASLFHLPHSNVETPSMVWASSKTAEPPPNLPSVKSQDPTQISPIGTTNFRGGNVQFGIKRDDRGRHLYIVGQTGTGKSFLLELLALSDIHYKHGIAIIDPHGDFATDIVRAIPEDRIEDVIYLNPTDTAYPLAFNPLEIFDPALKGHISSEIVGVLKRMFGYSWGPRLEYILRYTILALLDYPNSTMLGITRMLTEKDFRKKVIKQIDDPIVKNFWVNEFASWNEKFATEAVAPILNKVGAFTANPLIRNIIGQPKSAINIREIMDKGKILIVNLSRGQIGEDNAAILGALLVTKIQLAAMSRADIPFEDRKPFYLYVDEFQNFATDSFAVILSEARKYGLNLTLANQYVSQMTPEVRDAVFGNVGNLVCFRIGADDAQYLSKYFAPLFEANDLIVLHNRHYIINMSISGEKALPFSATSLTMPKIETDFTTEIIERSREQYGSPRTVVEERIARWSNFINEHKPNTLHSQLQTEEFTNDSRKSAHNELQPDQPVKLR
jgi:hypothetical protein